MIDDDDEEILLRSGPGGLSAVGPLLAVGQVQRARELALAHLAADPDDPFAHLALSRVHEQAGDAASALASAEAALGKAPDLDVAWLQRAAVLLELGRFAESEESVRRAIALDPDDAGHHGFYASLLSVCDRDVQALRRAEHALSLDPDRPWLHTLRAQLMLHVPAQEWLLTEEAARTALRLDPESPRNHAVLGLVLFRSGRNEEAEERFRSALAADPNEPLALRGLSELVKGRSPLYRPMLWFGQLMSRLGPDGQLAVLFGLWALYATASALIPPGDQNASDLLTAGYLGLCAYTWFAEPITRALLRRAYPWLT